MSFFAVEVERCVRVLTDCFNTILRYHTCAVLLERPAWLVVKLKRRWLGLRWLPANSARACWNRLAWMYTLGYSEQCLFALLLMRSRLQGNSDESYHRRNSIPLFLVTRLSSCIEHRCHARNSHTQYAYSCLQLRLWCRVEHLIFNRKLSLSSPRLRVCRSFTWKNSRPPSALYWRPLVPRPSWLTRSANLSTAAAIASSRKRSGTSREPSRATLRPPTRVEAIKMPQRT